MLSQTAGKKAKVAACSATATALIRSRSGTFTEMRGIYG
jgi:hypothetical protein